MNSLTANRWKRIGYYVLLVGITAPFLLPLWWMIATAFKPAAYVYVTPPRWLPIPFTWDNLTQSWGMLDFARFVRNSLWVTGLSVIGTTSSSALVGYAFAVLPARGREAWFRLVLGTIMVPTAVTLIPRYILFSKLGWVDSYLPLIVPTLFGNAFYIFMFRQFFRGLSAELFDAAELDGCNPLTTFWHIALPLSRPAWITVAAFSLIAAWNDFLDPLIYLHTTSKYTVPLGLALFQGMYYTQLHLLMPMSLVALLPVILLFALAQRHLVRGITTSE